MNAATHLGVNYKDNLVANRNTNFNALRTLFDITQKLILKQKHEIRHVSTIDWQFTPLDGIYFATIELSKAKKHVCSDSVFLFGKDAGTSGRHGEVDRSASIFPGVQ